MWFDSSSIANLAKNALKEAQKHIDNVLDIKEEDLASSVGFDEDGARMVKSKTMPEIKQMGDLGKRDKETTVATTTAAAESSMWGSFNGSFFESPKANQATITNPPPPRRSETSSESLEVLSKSPSSASSADINSSSQSTLLGSAEDSVEVINITKTPSHPDDASPLIATKSDLSWQNSNCETDDSCYGDGGALMTPDEVPSIPITIAPVRSVGHSQADLDDSGATAISTSTLTNSGSESFYDPSKDDPAADQSLKTTAVSAMDKSMESFEIQTHVSDSTQSFEEINLQKLKNVTDAGKSRSSSGDELETATSSDIEIISSPNGDSSSNASCSKALSPQKSNQGAKNFPYQNSDSFLGNLQMDLGQKERYTRELSDVSALSSDECGSPGETERLLKRISELSENLEQREMQLVQIGRVNTELQEEHTQRLSALEKKFQQSIRENAILKKKLDTWKIEAESKVSAHEFEKMSHEYESTVETLKQEGEKLSKQILQHSTAIKKLKAKLKENDDMIKRNESQIADLTEDNQKLKKNLVAKDEIEKSQSEGISRLTTEKRKCEKDYHALVSQNEDLQQKFLALQTSYDAMRRELNEKSFEMSKNLEEEKEKALAESRLLRKELTDLCEINRSTEQAASSQLQKLRQESIELKRKLELAEFRIEDQKQEASLASVPLIKQLESLQNTLNVRSAQWENQERILLAKLDETQARLTSQSDTEKEAKDQVTRLNMKLLSLEEKLSATSLKLEQTIGELQQKEIESNLRENDLKLRVEQLSIELSSKSNEVDKFKGLLSQAEENVRLERNALEEEKRKLLFVQQQNHHHHHQQQQQTERQDHDLINDSPVLSMVGSVESLSHPWAIDDQDIIGANSTYGSQYGGIVNSSASLMEGLQSVLKQRDGEVQQLQWEIHRLQTERNFLSTEMSQLTAELEKATENIREISDKQLKQEETQIQYDALLEMYGQKVEEYEELKLDLVDLKSISEMYKIQIDELTQRLNDKSNAL